MACSSRSSSVLCDWGARKWGAVRGGRSRVRRVTSPAETGKWTNTCAVVPSKASKNSYDLPGVTDNVSLLHSTHWNWDKYPIHNCTIIFLTTDDTTKKSKTIFFRNFLITVSSFLQRSNASDLSWHIVRVLSPLILYIVRKLEPIYFPQIVVVVHLINKKKKLSERWRGSDKFTGQRRSNEISTINI